ncbi:testis-specific serine/threonine-protein kinase 3-like [Actinia tenebrosa]|uniref:Testis-specific serine/threonine-protein kinase 3-like n=1 Tax=Actinia tenebrosa TaxID=6105 RepID=A0A6P8IDQ6_ACTTE|nr:testis-specific serine/threonine-protein kinase 3-like [Actinia tenebrosa]
MIFEVIAFAIWVICILVYLVIIGKNILGFKISNGGETFINFGLRQSSFDLRRVPSHEGDDVATYLIRQGYKVGSRIGEGAYAVVREAYSNRLGRNVAIKIIDKQNLSDRSVNKFLRREVEALRKVDHENVICLLEVMESEHRFYIIMELAHNGDMLKLLQERGKLTENEARIMFRKVVKGILHCHEKGIAHRDLKLENILLSNKNEPIISDFGFARYVGGKNEACQTRSRSCTFCGSYAYAAPEILQGIPYDATCSDVWSLGVVLFSMVTGQFPFDDRDRKQLLRLTLAGDITYPTRASCLSEQVKDLIKKMLTADISTRITLEEVLGHPWMKRRRRTVSMETKRDSTHSFSVGNNSEGESEE